MAVAQIGFDIRLGISQLVWVSCASEPEIDLTQIITSYSLCFAACLLFAGRLSDLFPASLVFEFGFAALGIVSLVNSFDTSNKYGFLILRGIGGVCRAFTIPGA